MKYRIFLENKMNGDEAEVIVPARWPLEEMGVKIKLEMHLPLCDGGWHKFLVRGTAYMPDGLHVAEEEILWECGVYPGRYESSSYMRLNRAFTTLQSSITYVQSNHHGPDYKIRCTLLERI